MNPSRVFSAHRLTLLATATLCLISTTALAADDPAKIKERITASGTVMKELLDSPSGVPISVLNKAYCVIVLPSVKKAGFIVGGEYGRGVMTCRGGANFNGAWTAPAMMESTGGSVGLQIGGEAVDLIILVMNDKGAKAVMNGKAKLGADAAVAAGPVGRDAQAATNASMSAEMLSYSRSQGVFGGLSLSGTTLGPDKDATDAVYGKGSTATQVITGGTKAPAEASGLLTSLTAKSPKRAS